MKTAPRTPPMRRAATPPRRAARPMRSPPQTAKVAAASAAMKAMKVVSTRGAPARKATGRASSGGVGNRGDGTRAGRGGAELDEERPRGALGVNDWYLGCNRPGPRVYADLFSQVKSGDCIEVVALDSAAEERGSLICEVIGQGIDGATNQSMVYVAVLAGSEPDLMSWAVPNLGAPNAVHLCKGDARDVDLSGADVYLLAVDAWRLRSPDSLTEPWAQAIGEGAALAGDDRPPRGRDEE